MGRYEDELSSRAMFLADAEPSVVLRLLEAWKEELWLRSKVHERARFALATGNDTSDLKSFAALPLLLARNLKHVTADIEFLDELSSAYRKLVDDLAPISKAPKRPVGSPSRARRVRSDEPGER